MPQKVAITAYNPNTGKTKKFTSFVTFNKWLEKESKTTKTKTKK